MTCDLVNKQYSVCSPAFILDGCQRALHAQYPCDTTLVTTTDQLPVTSSCKAPQAGLKHSQNLCHRRCRRAPHRLLPVYGHCIPGHVEAAAQGLSGGLQAADGVGSHLAQHALQSVHNGQGLHRSLLLHRVTSHAAQLLQPPQAVAQLISSHLVALTRSTERSVLHRPARHCDDLTQSLHRAAARGVALQQCTCVRPQVAHDALKACAGCGVQSHVQKDDISQPATTGGIPSAYNGLQHVARLHHQLKQEQHCSHCS
mmetsp:Transcript_23709/g.52034  ORF Transcript_23709/g.52034 Transcript_23709/m.52034 type:complete len:257 (+) Transcript_23709:931-1701(+)